jgi:hypothetical protein
MVKLTSTDELVHPSARWFSACVFHAACEQVCRVNVRALCLLAEKKAILPTILLNEPRVCAAKDCGDSLFKRRAHLAGDSDTNLYKDEASDVWVCACGPHDHMESTCFARVCACIIKHAWPSQDQIEPEGKRKESKSFS